MSKLFLGTTGIVLMTICGLSHIHGADTTTVIGLFLSSAIMFASLCVCEQIDKSSKDKN